MIQYKRLSLSHIVRIHRIYFIIIPIIIILNGFASHRLNADHSIFPFFILPCMLSLFLRLVLNCSSIYLFIIICMYHFSLVGQCYKVDTWLIQYVNLCEQNDV